MVGVGIAGPVGRSVVTFYAGNSTGGGLWFSISHEMDIRKLVT